ncbi:hypothetical protein ACQJBY_039903 [Aegilops geniculata]
MDDQSYFELLQSDVGLNDLHWTEEEQMDLEKDEEEQTDLEGPAEPTPPMTARSLKAKGKKSSASKRQKNFSKAEDLTLVDAYLEITQDPIIGVDQSRDCYWKRIDAYFHANKSEDHGSTQGSLQHRWAIIQEQVNRFCACYSQVLNRNQSGMTRENKLCQAIVLYANGDKANKSFGLMHCFNKLEDTEKWKSRPQKKQKTSSLDTPNSSSASLFEDEATSPSKVVPKKRPPGIKRAKDAAWRAQSSSSTGNSSAMESFGGILETRESKRQERFELMIAMDKQREEDRLVEERKKLAIQEKKMELEEEKIRIMRMAEERMMGAEESKIMSMDLSGMDEQEQEFYKLRKSQIINRHRNSSA